MAVTGQITIIATEVRDRFGLTTEDIGNKALVGAGFILKADAWALSVLANSGVSLSSLEDYEAALLKDAKLLVVGMAIISRAQEDDWSEGPLKFKSVPANQRAEMIKALKAQISDDLDMAGLVEIDYSNLISGAGGTDYMPGLSSDKTQIDIAVAKENSDKPFGVFPA